MIETATTARSAIAFAETARRVVLHGPNGALMGASITSRIHSLKNKLGKMFEGCADEELNSVYDSYSKEIDKADE